MAHLSAAPCRHGRHSHPPDTFVRRIRHAYRDCVTELGARWSDTDLVKALRAFADATGLHCLHDIAS